MDSRALSVNYAEKDASKQGFPAFWLRRDELTGHGAMQNPRVVSELLQLRGKKPRELGAAIKKRAAVLDVVRASLSAKLASRVASAGLEGGRLTLGVTGAVWASRLRYCAGSLRADVGAALHADIVSVRIRVLPPSAP